MNYPKKKKKKKKKKNSVQLAHLSGMFFPLETEAHGIRVGTSQFEPQAI
jgi:hypothetical protein